MIRKNSKMDNKKMQSGLFCENNARDADSIERCFL